MHVSGRMGWDVGEIKAYYLCSPSPFTFFSTRPVSCWIPVFMLFTAVHRPHRLGSKNSEPVWTGEVFLTAHLHKDLTEHTHTHKTHAHLRSLYCCRCRCWWEGSLILLAACPSSSPLGWCHPSGTFLDRVQPREIQSMPSFFPHCSPPSTARSCFAKSIMQICACLRAALNLRRRLNFNMGYTLRWASWSRNTPTNT